MSRFAPQRGSVSTRQLILAVGLGAVLIWVVSDQLPVGESDGQSSTVASAVPASTAPTRASGTRPAATSGTTTSLPELSDGEFARIVGTNPFVTSRGDLLAPGDTTATRKPAPVADEEPQAPPRPNARQQAITQLANSSVRLFYSSSRGSAVVLDDRVLRPGDVIDDVARVKSISEHGVELEVQLPPADEL